MPIHRAPHHDRRAPGRAAGGRGPSRTSSARTSSRASPTAARSCPGIVGYRRLGHPGDRERDPGRPRPRLPRRARAGQDADGPPAHRPARRVAAGRSAAGSSTTTRTRPVSPAARAIVEQRGRRCGDRLAAARSPLRREAGDARHHDRRPHRRGRPDQDRRGTLPVRRADAPLRADPAGEPGHRRDQRAARPRRADPGRSAQRARGARRPDPRLHRPPAARPVRRRQRQPRGLHLARPDHHAAQGPPRLADPDPLPALARPGAVDRRAGEAPLRPECDGTATPPRPTVVVPPFMEEVVAEITQLARRSPEISQRSGVSVRVSVANMEVLEAAALKRAVRLGEAVGRAAGQRSRRGRRLDRRQGRARIGRRRGARGARRRAADHEGPLLDVQPAGDARRPRRRSSRRSRTGSSSRPASERHRASTSRGCARCPGWTTPSPVSARST